MKKLLAIFFIFSAPFVLSFFNFSCQRYYYIYYLNSIQVSNMDYSLRPYQNNDTNRVSRGQYGMVVQLQDSSSEFNYISRYPILQNLTPACYAFEDAYPELFTPDVISNITIYTLFDFDANHPAGSEVNALFGAKLFPDDYSLYTSLDELLTTINDGKTTRFNLYLLQSPDTPIDSVKFKIEATINGDLQLSDTTKTTFLY